MPEVWRRCADCQVQWHSAEPLCWMCGEPADVIPPPPIFDCSLYTPISERAWGEVRRQIGADD